MIIVGDIACPSTRYSEKLFSFFSKNKSVFGDNALICNFEGLVCDDISHLPDNTPVLYNHSSVVEVLKSANFVGVGMANNHTLDLPECFKNTQRLLGEKELLFTGAGLSKEEAIQPFAYKDGEIDVLVFNFCWDFLLYHQNNPAKGVFVAELEEHALLNAVKRAKKENPKIEVLVYIHWSFDLETLPFPSYRQFSKLLIDTGVSLVIGCHSHCVQGAEKYKDGYIVYGLGNFFIPQGVYAGGKLTFPEMSRLQLAFEYNFETKRAKCHWFQYQENSDALIEHLATEDFEEAKILQKYSPYSTMEDQEYVEYFKANRRKRFLVPIYVDINQRFKNRVFTYWLKARANILRMMAKYNLRKWQN